MSNTQSPTPETDEHLKSCHELFYDLQSLRNGNEPQLVRADFARTLERQRDEARRENAELQDTINTLHNLCVSAEKRAFAKWSEERTTLLAQIAVKDEALNDILSHNTGKDNGMYSTWIGETSFELCRKAISPTASNELVERLTLLKQQVETLEHSSEDNFVQNLFSRLHELGIDTSDCDGEDAPYRILADWIATRMKDEYVKQRKS